MAAQECLPNNEKRDAFAADYSCSAAFGRRSRPTRSSGPTRRTTAGSPRSTSRSSRRPATESCSGTPSARRRSSSSTRTSTVQAVRDDLETLVLDADVIEELVTDPGPEKTSRSRSRSPLGCAATEDPKFVALSERLENLKCGTSKACSPAIEFLKGLLELAKDVVEAEREIPAAEEDRGKAALTELFETGEERQKPRSSSSESSLTSTRSCATCVSRLAADGGGRAGGEKALRKSLLKYKLHTDQDLFDRAYGYIVQYY